MLLQTFYHRGRSVNRFHFSAINSIITLFVGASITQDKVAMIADLFESWFIFSLIWTMGATCDKDGRAMFDEYIRRIMKEEGFKMMFPTEGLVYDYKLYDGGASEREKTEDEEVEVNKGPIQWITWMQDLPAHKVHIYL